jgi:hypothetical protein
VAALEREAERKVAKGPRNALASLPGDIVASSFLRHGDAEHEIVDALDEGGYDLTVVGSRGRGRVASTLFGSVGAAVHFHTHVPMLIVHPNTAVGTRSARPPDASWPPVDVTSAEPLIVISHVERGPIRELACSRRRRMQRVGPNGARLVRPQRFPTRRLSRVATRLKRALCQRLSGRRVGGGFDRGRRGGGAPQEELPDL